MTNKANIFLNCRHPNSVQILTPNPHQFCMETQPCNAGDGMRSRRSHPINIGIWLRCYLVLVPVIEKHNDGCTLLIPTWGIGLHIQPIPLREQGAAEVQCSGIILVMKSEPWCWVPSRLSVAPILSLRYDLGGVNPQPHSIREDILTLKLNFKTDTKQRR